MSERDLFIAALKITELAERSAWLDRECGGDAALRQRIDALLQAFDKAGSLLENPVVAVGPTVDEPPILEQPGAVIGTYKLIERIGEGGMGTVWMAQQTEPVKRVVALKLIKAGMDSRQVIARFEAERQALALMDHSNIARVLQAGATSAGRPYFVMDLVRGIPITKYCDEHHLTPRQRLELFVPVCQAVQHAHQKGIIHRDLKPSNVLIALYDGKPVPKVIDFGLAKATGHSLTEQTLVTGFGAIVGTLEYMSPEQAEINQLDIDTRCDIYALGVLLYELLTGSPPFTKKDLEKTGMLNMLRLIREQEPSKPSTKLSTAEGLPTLAANRGTEPAKLAKLVRGELDWIVMKALEKDRNRRYDTASAFAADVGRYLNDEAVRACPPSAWYRFRKFVRRNRVAFAVGVTGVLLAMVLVAGLVTGVVMLDRANTRIAEKRDEAQRQRQFAMDAVDDMYSDVAEEWLQDQAGLQPIQKKFLQKAVRYYEDFAGNGDSSPETLKKRGVAYSRVASMEVALGNYQKAKEAHEKAIALLEQLVADFPDNRVYRRDLVQAYQNVGVLALGSEGESSIKRALQLAHELAAEAGDVPEYWEFLARGYNQLACVQDSPKRLAEMETSVRQYLMWAEKLSNAFPDDPRFQQELANAHNTLGEYLHHSGRLSDAEKEYGHAIEFAEKALARSPINPGRRQFVAVFSANLAEILSKTGRASQAEASYRRCIDLYEKLIEDYPDSHGYRANLAEFVALNGDLYVQLGRLEAALEASRKVVAICTKLVQDLPGESLYRLQLAKAHLRLGMALAMANHAGKAIVELSKALELNNRGLLAHKQLALAHAMTGDLNAYRSVCAAMLDRFGRSQDVNVVTKVSWTLVVGPDAVNDLDQVIKLAEIVARSNSKSPYYSPTMGAALYRAGRFEEALPQLNKASAECPLGARADSPAIPWFFLAMTHHRLGHKEEARQWLAKAVKRVEEEKRSPKCQSFRTWEWRLISQLLRRESEGLLKGSGPALDKPKG